MRIGMYAAIDCGDVLTKDIDYIAIDQGLSHLIRQGITPVYAIGDFDSLQDDHILHDIAHETHPTRKDDSDTELAIKYALKHGYDTIDLYGVTGGERIDHFISVLLLLKRYRQMKINVYDRTNYLTLLPKGVYDIPCGAYRYFSCFAYQDCILTLKNCAYELDHYVLKRYDPLCLSNTCHDMLHLETSDDLLFVLSEAR